MSDESKKDIDRSMTLKLDSQILLVKLAYFAGIVDGEGYVGAARCKNAPNSYRVAVQVGMTDPQPPTMLQEAFGGKLRLVTPKGNRKPVFVWCVFAKRAATVLEALMPYLTVKKNKARLAIALAKMHYNRNQVVNDHYSGRFSRIPTEEIFLRKHLYDSIRESNSRGIAVNPLEGSMAC